MSLSIRALIASFEMRMSDEQFRREYLGEFKVDDEYELFVKAWMAYHRAAHDVDGHLPPGHPDQARLGHLAVRAGKEASNKHVHESTIWEAIKKNDWKTHNKWIHAKLEALRRLGLD